MSHHFSSFVRERNWRHHMKWNGEKMRLQYIMDPIKLFYAKQAWIFVVKIKCIVLSSKIRIIAEQTTHAMNTNTKTNINKYYRLTKWISYTYFSLHIHDFFIYLSIYQSIYLSRYTSHLPSNATQTLRMTCKKGKPQQRATATP